MFLPAPVLHGVLVHCLLRHLSFPDETVSSFGRCTHSTHTCEVNLVGALCCAVCWGRQLGVVKYLQQHFDLSSVQLRGASAGGLVACLCACSVDPERAVR